jgi:uncharacterized RDD family membrane protein YckC
MTLQHPPNEQPPSWDRHQRAPEDKHQPPANPSLPTYGQGDESYGVPTGYYSGQDATASMGKRALARLVDLLLISVVAVPVGQVVAGGRQATSVTSALLQGLVIGLVWMCYDAAMVAGLGRTVGMLLLKLRVCNEATGEKLNVAAAIVRAVISHGLWLVGLGLGALLIYLSPFFDSSGRRQGWHDKLARDVVINDQ